MKNTKLLKALFFAAFFVFACAFDVTIDESNFFKPHESPMPAVRNDSQMTLIPITIQNGPGSSLNGYLFKTNNFRIYLIYFTGVGEEVLDDYKRIRALAISQNINIISVNYRGYGKSSGKPTFDGLLSDSLLIFDYVREKYLPEMVFVHGHSLGTIYAEYIGAKRNPSGVILEAPFTNAEDALQSISDGFIWPVNLLVRFNAADELAKKKPQPEELIKEVKEPLLIFHGTKDTSFPPYFSKKIYANAGSQVKKLVIIEGGEHFIDLESEQVTGMYKNFLQICAEKWRQGK